jgi:hypothetical protein
VLGYEGPKRTQIAKRPPFSTCSPSITQVSVPLAAGGSRMRIMRKPPTYAATKSVFHAAADMSSR